MRLLDLFCGAGGCAVGYSRAGFDEIVGVDINPQPRYPFRFVQADALDYVSDHGHEYDAIHASPPCQGYSRLRGFCVARFGTAWLDKYPMLIEPVRNALLSTGRPYVIENVEGAPLREPIVLCGAYLGLKVYRHRAFECSFPVWHIPHLPHRDTIAGKGNGHKLGFRNRLISKKGFVSPVGNFGNVEYCKAAMGINWMTADEMSEAIPPAYTEWIGQHLMMVLNHA